MNSLEVVVFSAIAEVLNLPVTSINLESKIDVTENWDSLTNMDILLKVEDLLGITFAASDLEQLNSSRSIIEKLQLN